MKFNITGIPYLFKEAKMPLKEDVITSGTLTEKEYNKIMNPMLLTKPKQISLGYFLKPYLLSG